MGRITARKPIVKIAVGSRGESHSGVHAADAVREDAVLEDAVLNVAILNDTVTHRSDTLAVEEPLEIRIGGTPLAVTMRTPGHDVELAAGFLVSEAVVAHSSDFRSAIHCGGPGSPGDVPHPGAAGILSIGGFQDETAATPENDTSTHARVDGNTYNVLDVTLAPGIDLPDSAVNRNFYTTSSCGVCGKASIDAVETASHFDISRDDSTVSAALLTSFPDVLRAGQVAFEKTGGLHAAALFDAETGEMLVVREDVGRHNAVDKVIGWALLSGRLPLRATVLQVSGRASFELVQKASMAGIPVLAAVSAPSSLAVELAVHRGVTLVGFLRGSSMNVYAHAHRVVTNTGATPASSTHTPTTYTPTTYTATT